MAQVQYLDGYDYAAIHEKAREVLTHTKRLKQSAREKYMEYFETIRDLLIENLIEKKTDIKGRLELISKYSNNSLDSIFLDTKFKIKYVYDIILSQKKTLSVFFSLLYIFITLIFFIHNY